MSTDKPEARDPKNAEGSLNEEQLDNVAGGFRPTQDGSGGEEALGIGREMLNPQPLPP
jgi:hypothetical protein